MPNTIYVADYGDGSPSQANVSAAVADAVDEDTVVLPSGTSTWATGLDISKAITLIGSGVGNTIIRDGVNGAPLLRFNLVTDKFSRLSGIEFNNNGRTSQETLGVIRFIGSTDAAVNAQRFRCDNCKFDLLNGFAIRVSTCYGSIDHNSFVANGTNICVYMFNANAHVYSDKRWSEAPMFGTGNFLFIETNTFDRSASSFYAIYDCYTGARAVIRYNTIKNGLIEIHGTESSGRSRGGRAHEIYANNFVGSSNTGGVVNVRSGTGVIYDNVISNFVSTSFRLGAYRDFHGIAPWGLADGQSKWDVNEAGAPFETGSCTSASSLTVTDSSKAWTVNQYQGYTVRKTKLNDSGTVTSATSASFTDASKTWTANEWKQCQIKNVTTGEVATIGSNTATSITWQESYFTISLGDSYEIWDRASIIKSNTLDTITFEEDSFLAPADPKLEFSAGDTFSIYRVVQVMDMPGRGQGALFSTSATPPVPAGWNDQVTEPLYAWNNLLGGIEVQFSAALPIVEGEHYFNETELPGYTPYVYPNPLVTETPRRFKRIGSRLKFKVLS